MSEMLATWIGAFLTLCIFSFLYRDNPFFRFAEALFAGISLGYFIGITLDQTFKPNLVEPLFAGRWDLLIPLLIGLNLYTRYIPRIGWLARYSLSFYVGYYLAQRMLQKLQGELLPQSAATIGPIYDGTVTGTLDALIVLVGVLAVLVYFFFSVEHKGPLRPIGRLGVLYLMLGFGAAFGYAVMARVSLLIGRMDFLYNDWALATLRALGG